MLIIKTQYVLMITLQTIYDTIINFKRLLNVFRYIRDLVLHMV